ncbi:fumarylacetoacetate hydrolase [Herbaspirillum frisingense GSF30]|uniref:Fumarylacetoacetate hydrolase n=1 Tax=Herbaspirillum frisingense GSF30 TaxID=864073 RepID=A0AAI9N238_9BURK|nr:fumarylacetoacetate hydrolase family protein [Herbaspirillum frisingense]EOA03036.1 fumarylacetoacetate hydrolase [Herbaspirillum frisingense GSF30]
MKFATLHDGSADGTLVLVARDWRSALPVPQIAATLIDAMARWEDVRAPLEACYRALNGAQVEGAIAFDPRQCMAPLPRAPQWLDASAFLNHGRLMEEAFKTPPIPHFDTVPVMYQGASDDFLGPHQDVPLCSESEGIDFEGEFGVVVGPVAMGASPQQAQQAVRLVLQLNDWSLRALGPHEMKTGFGFLQAKPSTAFAPIAVTPDELGEAWRDGRVQMHLQVQWNGVDFGQPHGGEMNFSFGELIAHAAHSRRLTAGCIIGSGTVSNVARAAGSACIAERRVIEKIDLGEIRTGFMRFGDEVRMQARYADGREGPFGILQQRVVQAP